jgi:hypothetical protein
MNVDIEVAGATLQSTKSGSGDKSKAFVINQRGCGYLAGIFAVIVALSATGLLLTQYEVRVARRDAAMSDADVDFLEKQARIKLLRVGAVLENALLENAVQGDEAETLEDFLQEHFDGFRGSLGAEELGIKFDAFQDETLGRMNAYLQVRERRADAARASLNAISELLSDPDSDFFPHRRPRKGRKGQKGKKREKFQERRSEGARKRKADDKEVSAKRIEAMIGRFFNRVMMADSVKITEEASSSVTRLFHGDATARAERRTRLDQLKSSRGKKSKAQRKAQKKTLKMVRKEQMAADESTLMSLKTIFQDKDAAEGVDVSQLREPKMVGTYLRELNALVHVKQMKDQLLEVNRKWKADEITAETAFARVQNLAQQHEIPFEWVLGDDTRGPGRGNGFKWWKKYEAFRRAAIAKMQEGGATKTTTA